MITAEARNELRGLDLETPVGISYSGGSSSEFLVEALIQGWLPRPKHVAVFMADTGEEHEWTYEAAAEVEERCVRAGLTFIRSSHRESLGHHLTAIKSEGRTRAEHPPLYILKDGGAAGAIGHRCTREFKTYVMRRAMSAWLAEQGLPKSITSWIGFSKDEAHRATKTIGKQDVKWAKVDFPMIRLGLVRGEAREMLKKSTGRAPRFSMCVFCPKKTPERWQAMSKRDAERAIEVDESIRDLEPIGITEGEAYACNRLIPVEQLLRKGDPQPGLPGLDDGGCDSGGCFL